MTVSYAEVEDYLSPDGSLRDFYITGISQTEWNRFIAFAPTIADQSVFRWGDDEVPLPSRFSDIAVMQQEAHTILSLFVAGAKINCHFFVDYEIELDFSPKEVSTEQKWHRVASFFQAVVDGIGRTGLVTHENSLELVIAEFSPVDRGD